MGVVGVDAGVKGLGLQGLVLALAQAHVPSGQDEMGVGQATLPVQFVEIVPEQIVRSAIFLDHDDYVLEWSVWAGLGDGQRRHE
jgi:hypothetical protein